MNKAFRLRWALVMVGAMLLILATACGGGKSITAYDCDKLRSDIIKLSEENRGRGTDGSGVNIVDTNPVILFIQNTFRETERTEERLTCEGIAQLNQDGHITGATRAGIRYYVEKDAAGDISKGYETYETDHLSD